MSTARTAREEIYKLVGDAIAAAVADKSLPEGEVPAFVIEQPADTSHGDFACNAAMVSARAFRLAPRAIAQAIVDHLKIEGTSVGKVEIAGPGFINFFLSPSYFASVLCEVCEKKEAYGSSDYGKGRKTLVEYVSANPTGPMHIGNARGGVLGDCLAAVLEKAGYDVDREFYVNDAGNQIEKFGLSLDIRYQQLLKGEDYIELPEDSYHGKDIVHRAKQFANRFGESFFDMSEKERRSALVEYALPLNIAKMKRDLAKYRVWYDTWFLESKLHSEGEVKAAVELLAKRGLTYEKEGAVWYKATEFGAEKDEVLIRANGNPTYYAADIAYHINKFNRGYDLLINVWGADHHGHVARLKGALDAAGYEGDKLEIVLMQLVSLVRDGVSVRQSKRSGKATSLSDLLKMVPVDAARFFFNQRESTTRIEFDLALAVKQDSQNPVYYVQYAHARICSIFRAYAEKGGKFAPASLAELEKLNAPEELELIRHIAAFDDEIISAAESREPSRMNRYVLELAAKFHKFYNACRVIGAGELTMPRLTLCECTRQVIFNVLTMLKIEAPERMASED